MNSGGRIIATKSAMNRDIAMILESVVYRGLLISSATLSMYLGYRLLRVVPRVPKPIAQRRLPEAHDFEAHSGKTTVKFRTSAPGLFFAFFGALVIVAQLIRPPELDFVEQTVKQPVPTSTISGNLHPGLMQPQVNSRSAEASPADRTPAPMKPQSPVAGKRSQTAIRPPASAAPPQNPDTQKLPDEEAISVQPPPLVPGNVGDVKPAEEREDEVESKSAHFGSGWMGFSGGIQPGLTRRTISHAAPFRGPTPEELRRQRLENLRYSGSHCFGGSVATSKPLYGERRLHEDVPESWDRFSAR